MTFRSFRYFAKKYGLNPRGQNGGEAVRGDEAVEKDLPALVGERD